MSRISDMIADTKEKLHALKVQREKRNNILEQIDTENLALIELARKKEIYSEASTAVLSYLERGRMRSKTIFEEIGTTAAQTVFGENCKVEIEYSEKRNASSAELKTTLPYGYDEDVLIPLDNSGGGLNDVVCFSFVIALLELINPKLEGPLMADETFKHLLNLEQQRDCGEMLRNTLNPDGRGAEGHGRQLIFVTHHVGLLNFADKVFEFILVKDQIEVHDITEERMND